MSTAAACVLLPWAAAVPVAMLARRGAARWMQVAACGATLALAMALWRAGPATGWLGDPLALGAAVLTAAAALAGAVAGRPAKGRSEAGRSGTIEAGGDPASGGRAGVAAGDGTRFAPAMALGLLGSVQLGLLADRAMTGWLGVAAAMCLASAAPLMRGGMAEVRGLAPPAAGALCLALLGTVLLSAGGVDRWSLPPGGVADPAMLAPGCVLLLAGYALAAGLAPLHGWLGAAQEAAPRELGVLLCAPLPGLALVLLLRVARVAAAVGPGGVAAGLPPDIGLAAAGPAGVSVGGIGLLGAGLLSVVLAGLSLWRGPAGGTVRLATLLHGGVTATAFGLGGSGAVAAGLLHLAVSGLARVAAVLGGVDGPAGGAAAGTAAGRRWLAPLVVLSLAGVPPLALFAGEFLVLTEMLASRPWLAGVLLAGMAAGSLGLLRRGLHARSDADRPARAAAWVALWAATLLALAMPAGVSEGLTRAAEAFPGG